jgi:hypothetical protein
MFFSGNLQEHLVATFSKMPKFYELRPERLLKSCMEGDFLHEFHLIEWIEMKGSLMGFKGEGFSFVYIGEN